MKVPNRNFLNIKKFLLFWYKSEFADNWFKI